MLAFLFFFFNDTATTEIYTLSLHDALPISRLPRVWQLRLWHPASHLGPREGRILAGFRLDFRRLAGQKVRPRRRRPYHRAHRAPSRSGSVIKITRLFFGGLSFLYNFVDNSNTLLHKPKKHIKWLKSSK